ncbi:hypothetical protein LTR94_037697, partial [Friedmanniomyces endolithicus]
MLAREAVEIVAREYADARVRQRDDAGPAGLAERAADEIGRIGHAHDLLTPVLCAGDQLENAIDDVGDKEGI